MAEGTDFGLVGVEAGKAFFKITVFGNDLPIYTPYIDRARRRSRRTRTPSCAWPRSSSGIEEWAYEYEQRNRYECPGGVIVPRVNMGAIRGGVPYKITKTVQQCAIYVDVRITPVQNPLDVREELRRLVAERGLGGRGGAVRVPARLRGRPARVAAAGRRPSRGRTRRCWAARRRRPSPPFSSMWRDINCFNEMRIPAITYGPGVSVGGGNFGMRIADLVTGAKLYALTALDLCNQERA